MQLYACKYHTYHHISCIQYNYIYMSIKKKDSTTMEFEHFLDLKDHGNVISISNLLQKPGVLLNGIPGGVQMHQVWGHSCHK